MQHVLQLQYVCIKSFMHYFVLQFVIESDLRVISSAPDQGRAIFESKHCRKGKPFFATILSHSLTEARTQTFLSD